MGKTKVISAMPATQISDLRPKPQQVDELNEQAFQLRLQDTRRALDLSLEARDLALKIDYQKGLAYSLFNRSLCHFILADQQDVEEKAFQALSLFQGLGDESGEARAYNLIASIYHRRAYYQRALEYIYKCLEIRRKIGDRVGEVGALNNTAVIYIKLAQYGSALEYLSQSLEIGEEIGDPGTMALTLGNIAEVYSEMGDSYKALEYYQRSLELNRQTNNRVFESGLLAAIGRIYTRLEDHATAIVYLEQGLEITQQIGHLHYQGMTMVILGISYQGCGQYERVESILAEALEIIRQIGDRYTEAEALNALSSNCLKQGNYPAAFLHLTTSLKIVDEIQADYLANDAHRLMVEVYENMGDYAQALLHHKAYHQTWEQIHSKAAERYIQKLSTRSEIERVQQEADAERLKTFELSQALEAVKDADEQKAQLLRQLEAQARVLEQLAREDGLTGVANRRWLDLQLAIEFERARRFQRPLSLAMLDLDNFKVINDSFSHQLGDQVLQKAATLLRDNCRSVDVIGRYGGDEFFLILLECGPDQALDICQRLCDEVAAFPWDSIHAEIPGITVSIGLCSLTGETSLAMMLAATDGQLYEAKHQGKNRVCSVKIAEG